MVHGTDLHDGVAVCKQRLVAVTKVQTPNLRSKARARFSTVERQGIACSADHGSIKRSCQLLCSAAPFIWEAIGAP